MRRPRLKLLHQSACYHIVCRITQGERWLGVGEKVYLISLLHRVARYCGIEVLTFCVMSNHFHLLVRIPEKSSADAALDVPRLINRVRHLYGSGGVTHLAYLLEAGAEDGKLRLGEEEAKLHRGRMHELSVFMKLLKQRFTMWHNQEHGTRGTLWTERFKSVLVESRDGERNPLEIVAAYIDLNPVRAGLVTEAKDYPYSGVGSAVGGDQESQQGLVDLTKSSAVFEAIDYYLRCLAGGSTTSGKTTPSAPLATALRSRQEALVKGAIVGSAIFVMEVLTTLMSLRRQVRPIVHTAGPLGGDLWVGQKFRQG